MRYLWFALLLPAVSPPVAAAQGACADVPKFFAHPPTVGEWAEMTWESKNKDDPDHMRMGVIKAERREGKQMYWFQMSMEDKGKRTILQMLTPWDVNSLRSPQPAEVVMKMGDQPAMKMSGGLMGKSPASKTDWRDFCAKSTFVGEESVTVPAGTFKTRHYHSEDGDTWASMDAPLWHIVKMSTKDGKTMVLSARGMGEKNEITEQPVDMKEMMANPQAAQKMKEEMEKNKASK
jgi:hypothetical protein